MKSCSSIIPDSDDVKSDSLSYILLCVRFQISFATNLWNVVSSFLHYRMEPRQHKQRLCSNGGVTAADKLRAPRVVRSLKIFLDSWWSLKREEVTSGNKTQSYRNKRKLCEKERRLFFLVFLGIAVMTVVVDLCVMVWIVFSACLFNLLYYAIWRLHPSKKLPLLNWKKIRLTSYVTFRLDCKRIVGNFG